MLFSSSVIHLTIPLLSLQLFLFPITTVSAGFSFVTIISVTAIELTNLEKKKEEQGVTGEEKG